MSAAERCAECKGEIESYVMRGDGYIIALPCGHAIPEDQYEKMEGRRVGLAVYRTGQMPRR